MAVKKACTPLAAGNWRCMETIAYVILTIQCIKNVHHIITAYNYYAESAVLVQNEIMNTIS